MLVHPLKRELLFAKRSIIIAGVFGLLSSVYLVTTGDFSTRQIARIQPMKLAAIEGLYRGQEGAGLVGIGILSSSPGEPGKTIKDDFIFKIEFPKLLSYMSFGSWDAFVPGINDLVKGNPEQGIMSAAEMIKRGRIAMNDLKAMKEAKNRRDTLSYEINKAKFYDPEYIKEYFSYFGYGFIEDENYLVPNVPLSFYSFHIMVALGFFFILFFILSLFFTYFGKIENNNWLLYLALFSIPLPYIAGQAGWLVAEAGRQPWVIQDLMTTSAAVSQIDAGAVQITFWLFTVIFTTLAIAEVSIMIKQIKIGPKKEGGK